ncbi:MAG: hypothetical protein WA082_00185 [Candidatus Moraniibacteriota bacterium]
MKGGSEMKWLIKKLLAFLGLYRTPAPVSVVEKANPFEAPEKTTIISARKIPFWAANFFLTRDWLAVVKGFREEFGVEEQEVVFATPPRRYGALSLSKIAPGTSVPLSRFEDIAALITAQPNGSAGILFTGGAVSVFRAKGKGGEVCEGFIFHSRERGVPPT